MFRECDCLNVSKSIWSADHYSYTPSLPLPGVLKHAALPTSCPLPHQCHVASLPALVRNDAFAQAGGRLWWGTMPLLFRAPACDAALEGRIEGSSSESSIGADRARRCSCTAPFTCHRSQCHWSALLCKMARALSKAQTWFEYRVSGRIRLL